MPYFEELMGMLRQLFFKFINLCYLFFNFFSPHMSNNIFFFSIFRAYFDLCLFSVTLAITKFRPIHKVITKNSTYYEYWAKNRRLVNRCFKSLYRKTLPLLHTFFEIFDSLESLPCRHMVSSAMLQAKTLELFLKKILTLKRGDKGLSLVIFLLNGQILKSGL